MVQFKVTGDLIAMLKLINQYGSTVCVGTCEHRLHGELHCLDGSQMLRISGQGYKNRLQRLVLMGLLNRQRVRRHDGKEMGQYTLTEEGLKTIGE